MENGSILIEGEAVEDINPPSSSAHSDPTIYQVNRAQFSWQHSRGRVVAGRQTLDLDYGRFISSARFPNNQQSYDGVRVSSIHENGLAFDGAYMWRVNPPSQTQDEDIAFNGDTLILNVSAPTPLGRLRAFHYALDLDDVTAASNQTSGVGLSGRVGLGASQTAFDYDLSLAEQRPYADNEAQYSVLFWRVSAKLEMEDLSFRANHERLGDEDGIAFQTPFAAAHAYLGTADLFKKTPKGGIRDSQIGADWRIGQIGPIRGIALSVDQHWFERDDDGRKIGSETDILFRAKLSGFSASASYSNFVGAQNDTDVQVTRLTLSRRF